MTTQIIKIDTHNDPSIMPVKKPTGDWFDLFLAEDVTIDPDEILHTNFGISVALPTGYEAHIVPRSSTFKKYGILLSNSMGVIDNAYRGKNDIWQGYWYVTPFAQKGTILKKGTRIAQFRIVESMVTPSNDITIESANLSHEENRGGFGTTGI